MHPLTNPLYAVNHTILVMAISCTGFYNAKANTNPRVCRCMSKRVNSWTPLLTSEVECRPTRVKD